jgi:hypothetical protein
MHKRAFILRSITVEEIYGVGRTGLDSKEADSAFM